MARSTTATRCTGRARPQLVQGQHGVLHRIGDAERRGVNGKGRLPASASLEEPPPGCVVAVPGTVVMVVPAVPLPRDPVPGGRGLSSFREHALISPVAPI